MSHRRGDSPLFDTALDPTVTLYIVGILVANCTSHRCKQIAIPIRLTCNACNLQSHPYLHGTYYGDRSGFCVAGIDLAVLRISATDGNIIKPYVHPIVP